MVGAVEKAMNGMSDEMARERSERDRGEKDREEREKKMKGTREREERARDVKGKKMEERLRILEDMAERNKTEDRVSEMEYRMERKNSEMTEEMRSLKDKMRITEERLENERSEVDQKEKIRSERIDKIEKAIRSDRKVIEELGTASERDKEIRDTKESEKEMERKVEAAMEEMKILNMDFGRECSDRKKLVEEAIGKLRDQVGRQDKMEFERIMKGTRVSILGKGTGIKIIEKGEIHTVPVLLRCNCRHAKEQLERIVRKAGIFVSFQWPKECMDFVRGLREKVEEMGYGLKTNFVRIRPVVVEGTVYFRADVKDKARGNFEKVAYWRTPPVEKEKWELFPRIWDPEWTLNEIE
jgi:signal transduction histidine kinase